MDPLYRQYLLDSDVEEDRIIKLDLDERRNRRFLNPDNLDAYVRNWIDDSEMHYLILDEVQKVEDFESVLNGFLQIPNLDVYVTGSNSKSLSSDIVTEFCGRGDEIRVFPLSFSEYRKAIDMDEDKAFLQQQAYGGMPRIPFFE